MMNDVVKIQAMKMAMRNPQTQKIMLNAARAPVGSTIREKAKNVLSSLSMTQSNRFQGAYPVLPMQQPQGQGGPKNQQPVMAMMPVPEQSRKIFLRPVSRPYDFDRAEPPINLTPPTQEAEGQGGPINLWQKFSNGVAGLFGKKPDGQGAGLTQNTSYSPLSVVSSSGPLPQINVSNTPLPGTSTFNPQGSISFNPQLTGGQTLQNTGGIPLQNTNPQVAATFPNLNTLGQNLQVSTAAAPTLAAPAPVASPTTQTGAVYGPPSPTSGSVSGTAGYQPTGNALTDYLMQSYGQGIGANAFALGVMADANKLHELFPNVPIDQLPVGASLSGQLMDLEDKLKKENNLDLLNQRLTQAVTQGVTLQDDLTAYIRGKDEYLNGIQGMLDKANETYLKSSMRSDPFYSKSMQQYNNYLTILKGRATQRYVDYLNMGISYHNSQMTNLQNVYNSAAQQVNDQFKWQSAITTEQYQNIKDTLTQMYTNVAQRAGLLDSTSKDSVDLLKSQWNMAADVAKVLSPEAAASYLSKTIPGLGNITASALVSPTKKTDQLSTAELDLVKSRVGTAGSLDAALNDSILKFNSIPVNIIAEIYAQTKAEQAKNDLSTNFSSFDSLYGSAKTESDQLSALIDQVKQSGGDASELETLKANFDTSFDKGFSGALDTYVQSHLEKFRSVLDDMKGWKGSFEDWLSGKGWFRTSREGNFDSTKSDSIDRSLAELMWNVAQANSGTNFKNLSASQIATLIYNQKQ